MQNVSMTSAIPQRDLQQDLSQRGEKQFPDSFPFFPDRKIFQERVPDIKKFASIIISYIRNLSWPIVRLDIGKKISLWKGLSSPGAATRGSGGIKSLKSPVDVLWVSGGLR